ncbi:ATP-binding cassette domain-containing protein [Pseudomonas sp. G5001]|nr:ATP-binding cassette domain-containing protein [Pseudomonas sp. G1002]NWB58245.1 ATP-binding cassette domain-containing protein [Pseudomonas sp. F1002]NWB74328.1 ATP-binding cassette domain-containing protein [Pseudomonas sp. G5001]NWC01188.1 ATP-binding cassette domain-containing protein [Pseudomonas sp. G1002]NWD00178.1 ATP-binding cassette domain-containing protein [Pseudomonas sp. P7779]
MPIGDQMQTLVKIACKQHTALLTSTVLTTIGLKLIALAPPLLLGEVVDALSNNQPTMNTLFILIAGFILAGCIQALVNPAQIFLLSKLIQQIVRDASINWIGQLLHKDFHHFSSWRIGHFIKSVERGITAHEKLLTFFVTVAFPMCLELLIVGGAFLYMGGSGVFLAVIGLSAIYLFTAHKIIRWRRKHIDRINEQEDELGAILFNTLKSGKSIKLEGAEHTATHPLNEAFTQYANAAVTVTSSGGFLNGIKILFISLATGGLLGWGVLDQLSGQPVISLGQLVATFSIAGSFLINITALTEGYRVLDQFLADQRRLLHLLSLPNFGDDNGQLEIPLKPKSTLILNPCIVTDTSSIRLTIKTAIEFTQSQSVAITGPSGAGKSTLLEVLAGLNPSLTSRLLIDDKPICELSAQAHLRYLRYCPQSPQFLEGYFDHSVLFGIPPSPHLNHAIEQLNLEEIVLNRSLSENASNISGGEAKRLSLLRLVNRPGEFNLFDEPSASIEQKLATPVWDLLFDIFGKRGLICVTHDVRHLHRFDQVIVMSNGAIIDQGPWSELANKTSILTLLSDFDLENQTGNS